MTTANEPKQAPDGTSPGVCTDVSATCAYSSTETHAYALIVVAQMYPGVCRTSTHFSYVFFRILVKNHSYDDMHVWLLISCSIQVCADCMPPIVLYNYAFFI